MRKTWGWVGLPPVLSYLPRIHAGSRADVDALAHDAPAHGWTALFAERYPYAGGPRHYAAFLANTDGFEVELVADDGTGHGIAQ